MHDVTPGVHAAVWCTQQVQVVVVFFVSGLDLVSSAELVVYSHALDLVCCMQLRNNSYGVGVAWGVVVHKTGSLHPHCAVCMECCGGTGKA